MNNCLRGGLRFFIAYIVKLFYFFSCRDVAQSGSALEWGSRGRRFKSFHPDQKLQALTVNAVGAFSVGVPPGFPGKENAGEVSYI